MKKIKLTQNQFAIVDDEDFEWLSQWKWHAVWDISAKTYYAVRKAKLENGKLKTLSMHRQIMGQPKNMIVDHVDGNTLNNTRKNLRVVNNRQNQQNQHKKNSSKYPGVDYRSKSKKWRTRTLINSKRVELGEFKTEREAFEAYRNSLITFNEPILPEWENA